MSNRKPINADAQGPKPAQPKFVINRNNNTVSTSLSNQQFDNNNDLSGRRDANEISGSTSPNRTRIAKRKLWWTEQPSEHKIPQPKPFKAIVSAAARVDHKNLNFNPSNNNKIKIETQKLEWKAEPVIDSWSNINHQPGGKLKILDKYLFC